MERRGDILPALRKVELQIHLASGAVLGWGYARARLGNVLVKEQGDQLLVGRNSLADTALGTAVAAISDINKGNLVGRRGVALLEGSGGDEAGAGGGGENESREAHVERVVKSGEIEANGLLILVWRLRWMWMWMQLRMPLMLVRKGLDEKKESSSPLYIIISSQLPFPKVRRYLVTKVSFLQHKNRISPTATLLGSRTPKPTVMTPAISPSPTKKLSLKKGFTTYRLSPRPRYPSVTRTS